MITVEKVAECALSWTDPTWMIKSGNTFYVSQGRPAGNTGYVSKVDIPSFTETDVASLSIYNPRGLVVYGNYLYVAGTIVSTNEGIISKIDLTSFTEVATLQIGVGDTQTWAHGLAEKDGYLYASILRGIKKINLSTFTVADYLEVAYRVDYSIPIIGNYIYATDSRTPSRIYKVDLSSFTVDSNILLSSGEIVYYLHNDSNYIYANCWTDPGMVVRIRLSDFTRIDKVTFDDVGTYDFNYASGGDSSGEYIFTGFFLDCEGTYLEVIDVSSFKRMTQKYSAIGSFKTFYAVVYNSPYVYMAVRVLGSIYKLRIKSPSMGVQII